VTGTLWSGAIGRGDVLELLPAGKRARVRGVQVHDQPAEQAAAGQRVAVNLTGVPVGDVARGDVLAGVDAALSPTYRVDAAMSFDGPDGDRVQIHHGTRESPARMTWLGGRFWQVRLEEPLMPVAGDRFVVRQIAPPDTLGGGVVLDAQPRRHGPSRELLARLERLSRGDSADVAEVSHPHGGKPRHSREVVELSPTAIALEERLKRARFEPPLDSELNPEDLAALRAAGRAVRVSMALHYHPDALAEVRRRVLEMAGEHGITLAQLRDELGTSRKFAQALLEHLDSEKVTIRRGDAHHVRRSAR
jgi:selenocysteine-specific elongation factor